MMAAAVILLQPKEVAVDHLSAAVARHLHGVAVIDVAVLHRMTGSPLTPPRVAGFEHRLAVHNACLLAQTYLSVDVPVLICDLSADETARIYRSLLADCPFRILLAGLERVGLNAARDADRWRVADAVGSYQLAAQLACADACTLPTDELATRISSLVALAPV